MSALMSCVCPAGAEVGLWDMTITNSPQGPTLEQLQKVRLVWASPFAVYRRL